MVYGEQDGGRSGAERRDKALFRLVDTNMLPVEPIDSPVVQLVENTVAYNTKRATRLMYP